MYSYDKDEIKEQLSDEMVFELLEEFGGDPIYSSFGIISATICHNEPGVGSHKLYYWSNSKTFSCWTNCGSAFDIFTLVQKVALIQWRATFDLNDAVRWVAQHFGLISSSVDNEKLKLDDWKQFAQYDRLKDLRNKQDTMSEIIMKEYDDKVLDNLNYSIKIKPWLDEGITEEAMCTGRIGYYPGGDQITIPHFDKDNRFIGLRGRTVVKEEAELYGKYRPIRIGKTLYNHPLGYNLYGLNWAKDNIKYIKKAIVFESEKSALLYMSYFGVDNNIAVSVCGSNFSSYQFKLLNDLGVDEIIIAFDKQYPSLGTDESQKWIKKLTGINNKYKAYTKLSFLFDKGDLLGYKSSPIDEGADKFLYLFKERIII